MERIDTSLTQRIITEAERHRVPVSSKLIHGAMNNYDNAGSHDFPFDSCIPSMTPGNVYRLIFEMTIFMIQYF